MRNWVIILVVVGGLFACGGDKEDAATTGQSGGSALGQQIGNPQAASPSEELNPELRKSFMEGCTEEFPESVAKEKAEEICGCMLDKGLAKWDLGEFMKRAMEGGKEVEALSLDCVKMAMGDDSELLGQPSENSGTGTASTGIDGDAAVKTSFVEGCMGPMKDTFGPDKARGICTCMFDEGTSKWSLGDFMKKAMEQGKEVEEIALKCMAAGPIKEVSGQAEESAPTETADEAPEGDIRETFIKGCVDPMVETFGKEKSSKICACMFDKGTDKWSLGDFMKKAMEQGDDVQKIAMECVTGNL